MSRSALTRMEGLLILVVIGGVVALAEYTYSPMWVLGRSRLIVSTTTSLYETGLLDRLKDEFEATHPDLVVSFISQGTGLAIQTAMRGDADLIIVHDPVREYEFLKRGYGVNRKIIAYNSFLIVGPAEDPADIAGSSPTEAFTRMRAAGLEGKAIWVSRGDDSGTHARENTLWKNAGFDLNRLRTEPWYLETGSGMTSTLKMADQKRGYTLTDVGTYLLNSRNRNIDLTRLVESGKDLLNVYSVIAANPNNPNMTNVNFEGSMRLIRYLVSSEGQDLIADFGLEEYREGLFKSYLNLAGNRSDSQLLEWIHEIAFFEDSECPPQFRYQAEDLYSAGARCSIFLMFIDAQFWERKTEYWIQSLKA